MRHTRSISGLAMLLTTVVATPALGQRNAQEADEARACAALMRADFSALPEAPTTITAAEIVTVTAESPAADSLLKKSGITRYCRVTGSIPVQHRFELRLPSPKEWNRSLFYAVPNGGTLNGSGCNPGVVRGYASLASNGGYDRRSDGQFFATNVALHDDWGWRDAHLVTVAAKAIIAKYYGAAPIHAIASGCSKGGQVVLSEIQRYPGDYDGAIAGAAPHDWVAQQIARGRLAQALDNGQGKSVLDTAALAIIEKSELALCGAQSGVAEGFVAEPLSCKWQPTSVACPAPSAAGAATRAPADCLTAEQVKAVAAFRSTPTTPGGSPIHRHAFPAGAAPWTTIADVYDLTNNVLRFQADSVNHPSASIQTFDYDAGLPTLTRARSIYESHQVDLRAFKARGGKLLLWHGLADNGVPATSSIDYYDAVAEAMGGRAAIDGFFRLFLFPGLGHCSGGPGPGVFDRVGVMEAWLTSGKAPDVIVAQHFANGVVDRTRPAFPYPVVARYRGSGDPKDAASFAPKR